MSAGRNDCGGTPIGDGVVAFSGVVGTVSSDAGNLVVGRDLVEQFGQQGGVTHFTARDFNSPNLQRLLVDPDVYPAPNTALRATVFAGVPFTFTLHLHLHPRP